MWYPSVTVILTCPTELLQSRFRSFDIQLGTRKYDTAVQCSKLDECITLWGEPEQNVEQLHVSSECN